MKLLIKYIYAISQHLNYHSFKLIDNKLYFGFSYISGLGSNTGLGSNIRYFTIDWIPTNKHLIIQLSDSMMNYSNAERAEHKINLNLALKNELKRINSTYQPLYKNQL